jgi:hypothetical protein
MENRGAALLWQNHCDGDARLLPGPRPRRNKGFIHKVLKQAPYLADLGEGELDAPHFALVAETILADKLQLLVKALLLKRAARGGVHLPDCRKKH